MKVRASQDVQLDGLDVTVGRRGVEWRTPASFPDIGLGSVFQQYTHDRYVSAGQRGLQGCHVQIIV